MKLIRPTRYELAQMSHAEKELNYFEEVTGHFWPIGLREMLVASKNAVVDARCAGQESLEPHVLEAF